ncbi:hypothetical protein [Citrobacter koseri]|uniref:hypothetical protein n=1 Tax=Citrobacter koseri TaxID=545 RepID=UPI0028BDB5AA|nr:hypothetical protein [Citrobacter koseri]MDT7452485.1 hypothetical protein [Citrobacter koseri]HEM6829102.1 hypothetical protein [Citrobacter koseri]HEM6830418.1 hypothetical protein [Citrobacter koseri]HEM6878732.1 hypothetical protein [Citrobacter koseri]HEM6880631.1 hypothetical protein [Citrobacter koseri]
MPQKTPTSVASYIYQLAKKHNITAIRDNISNIAIIITALSGDDIKLDDVEQLLVNLKRKGFLTKAEMMQLEGRYLREKKYFRTE